MMPAKKPPMKHMMPDGSMMKGKMTKAQMDAMMKSKKTMRKPKKGSSY